MTEKTDPQPLTDAEVESWITILEMDVISDIPFARAIARIRADGRRIERLEGTIREIIESAPTAKPCPPDNLNYDDTADFGMDLQLFYTAELLRAALEDKTK